MKQNIAEYFAELLTAVTYDNYVVEHLGLRGVDDYSVCRIASNGEREVQPRGNIRVALKNAARQCRNGLKQL